MADSHECPVKGCAQRVSPRMLMCRPHWYMVPAALRDAVWSAWDGGRGQFSREHRQAITDAIKAVNERMEARHG